MAGRTTVNQVQLGDSATATQNFTLETLTNGTARLARGNAGATTQDIMTVAATGAVDFPQLARSLGASGYATLPGGLIVQWGSFTNNATANTAQSVTFPIAFPTAVYVVVATLNDNGNFTQRVINPTTSGFAAFCSGTALAAFYIALGR